MDNLYIKPTKFTPEISMQNNGIMTIRGMSFPKNTKDFYSPVMLWLKKYFKNNTKTNELIINIDLSYFNVSTLCFLFELFNLLDSKKNDFSIIINCLYRDNCKYLLTVFHGLQEEFDELIINLDIKQEG